MADSGETDQLEVDDVIEVRPADGADFDDGMEPLAYIDHIFERELKLTLRGVELGSERDDSMRELTDTAASLYDGRIVRELIQNAYDGSGGDAKAEILIRLDLTAGAHGILDVANTGSGFTRDDVDSIANPARSRKRPGNSIGHKGLGFRSVTLISDNPQIYSSRGTRKGRGFDGYCFRFATLDDQLARLMDLGSEAHARIAAGKTHSLQLPVPIASPSSDVTDYAERFATLIRLPLSDETAASRMEREWQELFDERAPITLFLGRLSKLTLERVDAAGDVSRRVLERRSKPSRNLPKIDGISLEEVESDGRDFLVASRTVDHGRFLDAVRRAIAQRHKVEKWLEWEGDPTVSVAIPLSGEGHEGRFYAFLPMEQRTPFNGNVDAPFFPDPDRRSLALSNALNDELFDVAAEVCLALLRGAAAVNANRAADVHAAVDAIAWSETGRIFRAMKAAGLEPAKLPLPVVSRPDTPARWSTLDQVFDWDDQRYRSLKATWMARVTSAHLLRRGMGGRRTDALRTIGDEARLSLEPDAPRLAEWLPMLAKDLERRRKATALDWESFYADLADRSDIHPHLKGAVIFRNESRRLVPAEGSTDADGRPTQFVINTEVVAAGRKRKRKRLEDTSQYPPSCITKGMEFADPTLAWPADVVEKLVRAGLASEFRLIQVVSKIGQLLGARPRKRDAVAVMHWAFRMWREKRGEEFGKALRKSGIMVPVAEGSVVRADAAYFSKGWRETQGDLLDELLREAGSLREFAALAKGLLPSWSDWPVALGETAQDWRDFLRLVGVRDGLPWYRTRAVTLSWYQLKHLRLGSLDPQEFERPFGPSWRPALGRSGGSPNYVSGEYLAEGLPYLPGQARWHDINGPAKLAYGRLVAHLVSNLPDAAWSFTFSRAGSRSDTLRYISPLAAFLKATPWVPAAGHDEFSGFTADACWLGARNEVPRFVPRAERTVRELIDGNQKLRDTLVARLGMPSWADPATAPRRIAALGQMLRAGIADAFVDDFRKALRETWGEYASLAARPSLPSPIVLAVDTKTGLEPIEISKTDAEKPVIFVDDGTRPVFQQILSALGHATVEVQPDAGPRCIEALRTDLEADARLIREDALRVEVDGQGFTPNPSDQLLVANGREWIADVAVLVLEVSTRLSSQNTMSARQALSDAVRKVRVRFANRITVSVDGSPSPLPPELDGVLPIPDEGCPTVLVEAAELDWETLSRIAAAVPLAIGRPALIDPFGLTFGALRTEMRTEEGWLAAPTDQQLAKVLRRTPARITELLRSLRATTSRLLELVLPTVHASGYPEAAAMLDERAERLNDDAEVSGVLARAGMPVSEAERIVSVCRDAGTLNEARRDLGIAFATLNASLLALGRPAMSFRERLLDRFNTRVEQRRTELERLVRDASRSAAGDGAALGVYVSDARLGWLTMPQAWIAELDDVDADVVDAELDRQMAAKFGAGPFPTGEAPERLRQSNRELLASISDGLRRLVRAWCRKEGVAAPTAWEEGLEPLGRAAVLSGLFDFERLSEDGLVDALRRISLWPVGMASSRDPGTLGLSDEELYFEEQEERRRQDQQLRQKRSLRFGDADIEGGVDGWFEAVAKAMGSTLDDRSFKDRSGPAALEAFGAAGPRRKGGRGGSQRTDDAQYMSQEQRDLIGFAGELAAYRYLQGKHRNMRGEHWVSSMGRRYLGLEPLDEQGFDFRVSDARGFVHYEVKAHTGDPGYVDLERSQVSAAASMRAEGPNRWRILYVANARSPVVTVHELPNPYTEESAKLFRDSHSQGVRLAVRRR